MQLAYLFDMPQHSPNVVYLFLSTCLPAEAGEKKKKTSSLKPSYSAIFYQKLSL